MSGLVTRSVLAGLVLAGTLAGLHEARPTRAPEPEALAPTSSATPAAASATGYVLARRRAAVTASRPGKLVEIRVEEGSLVEKDEVLARLEDGVLKAELARSKARFDDACRELERCEKLFPAGLATAQELDRRRAALEVTRAERDLALESLAQTVVRAPFAGVVTAKLADVGELAGAQAPGGAPLVLLVDLSRLEVEADVPEARAGKLRPGQAAEVELDALPGVTVHGSVRLLVPAVDRKKATIPVRVALEDAPSSLRTDMCARVTFVGEPAEASPAAPSSVPASVAPLTELGPDAWAHAALIAPGPREALPLLGAALAMTALVVLSRRARREPDEAEEDDTLYILEDDLKAAGLVPGAPVVSIRGLEKSFQRGSETVHVLRGVDLDVRRGELLALMGPSGSGKSTLLGILAGLDRPSAGSVRVGDTEVSILSQSELAAWRARTVGIVFQFYNLVPVLTALENVELPLLLANLSAEERRARARRALELVGLKGRMDHRPAELSGGQEQRVAIARAIVTDPEVIVADEPTGDLDAASASAILDLLARLATEQGKAVIMVTHDAKAAARAHVTRYLEKGRMLP